MSKQLYTLKSILSFLLSESSVNRAQAGGRPNFRPRANFRRLPQVPLHPHTAVILFPRPFLFSLSTMPSAVISPVVQILTPSLVDLKASKVVSPELSSRLALGGVVAAAGSSFKRGPKPNLALWVTNGHEIYLEEVPYPSCSPDTWCVPPAGVAVRRHSSSGGSSASSMFAQRVSVEGKDRI